MILLSRYSWLGRYLWVARCCWSVSSWKSPSSAVGGHRESGVRSTLCHAVKAKPWCPPAAGMCLPLHCSRWETSSAALLSLQGSRPSARSFLIWSVKRYLWRGQEMP